MTSVFIHIGQAGVQIGSEVWQRVLASAQSSSGGGFKDPTFLDDAGCPRAILVDSEPKPIMSAVEACRSSAGDAKRSGFREANLIFEQHGRGNHWGLGYNGPRRSEGSAGSLSQRCLEALRKEAERCDTFAACLLTHSVAGGTGSGLGSRILEELRHAYPKQFVLTAAVTPLSEGETPLQHYNTMLTLAHCQRYADCAMLFSNQDVLSLVGGSTGGVAGGGGGVSASSSTVERKCGGVAASSAASSGRVGMASLNSYIVDCLLDVLSPTRALSYYAQHPAKPLLPKTLGLHRTILLQSFQAHDFVASVSPLPGNKFVELWTTRGLRAAARKSADSGALTSWPSLSELLSVSVPRFNGEGKACKTLCYQAQVRGDNDGSFAESFDKVSKKLRRLFPAVEWNPFPQDIKVTAEPPTGWTKEVSNATSISDGFTGLRFLLAGSKPLRSITVAVNRDRVAGFLQRVVQRSKAMFDSKAYLHWYQRYGVETEQFASAFEDINQIVANYDAMTA